MLKSLSNRETFLRSVNNYCDMKRVSFSVESLLYSLAVSRLSIYDSTVYIESFKNGLKLILINYSRKEDT